ncbi:MAG: (E)-4-hydroxy-3-methylbut-2-enyl-diphosphate synthase [Bacteroidales bacterium]|nr:(E)-4-hydroxy-3-methylbut-2-enyl-diphosphate synthase [Bacteroidales bacterium]
MSSREIRIGNLRMGGGNPIVVQTMCDTHTRDVEASFRQCIRLHEAGAQMIRLTVPTPDDVAALSEIKARLRASGIGTPLVADVHFSSEIAIAAASVVEKVRINPGNFHRDYQKACERFSRLIEVCKDHGTAIRIGLNHGSLGERITHLYGNTPQAMCNAAMEWLRMCAERDFHNVCVSLKASNTLVMTEAYRLLHGAMEAEDLTLPLHVGVTEAGNGDSGRIKSVVGISTLLSEGIGDTIRVSLTEPPENELPVAQYLADRYEHRIYSTLSSLSLEGRKALATYCAPSRERLLLDFAADFGKRLLDKTLDEVVLKGTYINSNGEMTDLEDLSCPQTDQNGCPEGAALAGHLTDELMQAARRRFYRPEYIACPGCGRTMYNLQETFEEVKRRTGHLQGMVIAVMGCIVNGPGEMADADWGYVGEGAGRVTIYHGKTPVLKHIPESEAVDNLLELIERMTKCEI